MHARKRIAVLMGGPSAEHDVSLETGETVLRHLSRDRFRAFPVAVDYDGTWPIDMRSLRQNADVAFVAMHGSYGEDGGIQAALTTFGIPYTGSRPIPSAHAARKPTSLTLLKNEGFPVPEFCVVHAADGNHPLPKHFTLPLFVKPANAGSSAGTGIVRDWNDLPEALQEAFRFSPDAIVQRYIFGKEVTCGILEINGNPTPLMPTEIIPAKELFHGPKSKRFMDGAWHLTPPRLSPAIIRRAQATALAAHTALGCSGMSQTDMIVDREGAIHLLEVNTIPKLSGAAPFLQGAQELGIAPEQVMEHIIASAHIA
ncbi:MAG: ATP-grasp domain-containing protein [Patescibacteria group bacterium]|nr:ATP-grasp domain-containing protein [Patescibacteria group bacterium]